MLLYFKNVSLTVIIIRKEFVSGTWNISFHLRFLLLLLSVCLSLLKSIRFWQNTEIVSLVRGSFVTIGHENEKNIQGNYFLKLRQEV